MQLFGNKDTEKVKRSRKALSVEKIDAIQKTNEHERSESRKNHFNNIVIIAGYGAMIGIPFLYLTFLYVNRHDNAELSKDIWSGVTALVGFLFGNLLKGLDQK